MLFTVMFLIFEMYLSIFFLLKWPRDASVMLLFFCALLIEIISKWQFRIIKLTKIQKIFFTEDTLLNTITQRQRLLQAIKTINRLQKYLVFSAKFNIESLCVH